MKRILAIALLFGAAHLASAGTTNIYVENWGSPNSSLYTANTLGLVGWTTIAGATTGTGPYYGIFGDSSATDQGTTLPLPPNTVYFTSLVTPGQVGPGMIYTTDTSGNGGSGNSAFTDIDPTHYTNLTLNVEVIGSTSFTNYFAVLVGGQWYVSVTPLIGGGTGQAFTNASLPYTNVGSAWDYLTISSATNVTIGLPVGGTLSGPIQGIGIVELPTSLYAGWNYNELFVSAFAPNSAPPVPATITAAPISQTVYAGGGASFAMTAAGTSPITYTWQTNGVTLTDGTKYTGSSNNFLTISNCTAGDGAATYSVSVTNIAPPGQTNSSFTLTVNPVPAGWLYAETYPYTGPSGNLGLGTVGWASVSISGTGVGIFSTGTGTGAVFDYAPGIGTNLNYTTDTNDTGFSGLPFVDINPDSFPAVTLQAEFTPGNGAGGVAGAITAYWAVQMGGSAWYSSAQAIPINISSPGNYLLNQYAYSRVATNWNNLIVSGGTVTIGTQASVALAGNITGAGLVFVHNTTAGASMNWQHFAITENAVTVLQPVINPNVGLESQSVPTSGGVSFAVATSAGTQPFTYSWSLNGVMLTNGGRISGATSPTLTIANCTAADSDPLYGQDSDNGNVVAYVSNYVGIDASTNYFPLSLQVTNAPIGQLYTETFPYVGPTAVMPISSAGWTEAAPGTVPNSLYQASPLTGEGAVFASNAAPGTTVYYATSGTDTNQSGLRFPSINLAFYPSLTIAVDIAPAVTPANVTTYLAVQINTAGGSNWYVATNPLPVPTSPSSIFATYSTAFNPAASKWKNLTVTGSGGIIGSAAGANLTGSMIGAGLVFVTTGSGGSVNIDNFTITGPGLGGINLGALTGSSLPLSWVGNPAVNLQSTTNLNPSGPSVWQNVPNTLGLYATNVSVNTPQKYFRLVAP
jgi:Immunoglobulin I-set domain